MKIYLKKHINEISKDFGVELSNNFLKELENSISKLLTNFMIQAEIYCEGNNFNVLSESKVIDILEIMGYNRFITDLLEELKKKKKQEFNLSLIIK